MNAIFVSSRSKYLVLSTAVLLLCAAACALAEDLPRSGSATAEYADFDAWMTRFMTENGVPGGALALVKNGRLVHARGYGFADRDTREPVQPESLFRIASVSKPITAVAILKLVEEGKLRLEDKVLDHLSCEPHFELVSDQSSAAENKLDERWKQITLAQCLAHSGGWDRGQSYDPMFQARRMAKSLGVPLPIRPEHIIRFQLGKPLDFNPGERYAYSNFGYSILGRILEKVTGEPYERHLQRAVLAPLGITAARIGGSLADQRVTGEVKYYDAKNGEAIAVVGPGAGEARVPISYGSWCQETLDAHGGWIASAPDLARFAAAFDVLPGEQSRGGLLKSATIRQMFSPHVPILSTDDKKSVVAHYGLGWMLKEESLSEGKKGVVARHGGALACTAASLMHFPDGINVAVLFNMGQFQDGRFFGRHLEGPITDLVRTNKALHEQ